MVWLKLGRATNNTLESFARVVNGTVTKLQKHHLCGADQVTQGMVVRIDLPDGLSMAVYNLDGAYYATDNLCTHGEASLAEGFFEGDNIVCPFHGGMFDIRTGEPTASPCVMPLRTYPVTVEDGQLFAEVI